MVIKIHSKMSVKYLELLKRFGDIVESQLSRIKSGMVKLRVIKYNYVLILVFDSKKV